MSTIFRDKVTIENPGVGVMGFNDMTFLPFWYAGTSVMAVDTLDGWDKTVSLNVISVPRGVGDGAYTAPKFPALARNLTIGGYVHTADRSAMEHVWDQIVADAFPADTDLILTRYETIPKYVTCRVASEMELTQYFPDQAVFRWEGTLLCSDPFKYDATNTLFDSGGISGLSIGGRTYPRVYPLTYTVVAGGEGNQAVISNIGTAKAYPLFTLYGPIPSGWHIDNVTTGASLAFDLDLGVGDVLVIDVKNKYATLNGFTVNGLVTGTWMQLVRGTNVLKLFADYNATAYFTVSAKSTWR